MLQSHSESFLPATNDTGRWAVFPVSMWAKLRRSDVCPVTLSPYIPLVPTSSAHPLPLIISLGVLESYLLNLPASTPSQGDPRDISNTKSGQEVKGNLD